MKSCLQKKEKKNKQMLKKIRKIDKKKKIAMENYLLT